MVTGSDIRRYRQLLGMKQGEFAERLGLAQSTLSLIEGGRIPVSDDHVARLTSRFADSDLKLRFIDFAEQVKRGAAEGQAALSPPAAAHSTLTVWQWEEGFDLSRQPRPEQAVDLVTIRTLGSAGIALRMKKRTDWWEAGDILVFERSRREDVQDGSICLVQVKGDRSRSARTLIAVAHLAPAKRGRVLQLEPISPAGRVFEADEAVVILRAVWRTTRLA